MADILEALKGAIEDDKYRRAHNEKLFDIYEGDALRYIAESLKTQLNEKSFKEVMKRVAPINLSQKITDKLSKIYQQDPVRHMKVDNQNDSTLLSYYIEELDLNPIMNNANEFYNLMKSVLVMPYVNRYGYPRLRVVPSNNFTVYSNDSVEPNIPTHLVTYDTVFEGGRKVPVYNVYSDEEFFIFDDELKIRRDLMSALNNIEGVNPIGRIPGIYINKSQNLLTPKIDSDFLKMILLVPVMLSDLNYAVMYQCFSIIYAIDLEDKEPIIAPNAYWRLKSKDESDKAGQIGSIKPQVDITETLGLIQGELSLWLQSKGIKPGSVGQLTVENAASGISKMIDEMDTTEERKKQVSVFKAAESNLWDLIVNHMHPYWRSQRLLKGDINFDFSSGAVVVTDFSEQVPLATRGQLIDDLKKEYDAGFISRERAIQKLNPQMSENEVKELIAEIDEEKGQSNATMGAMPELQGDGNTEQPMDDNQPSNSDNGAD